MPTRYRIDARRGILFVETRGVWTEADFRRLWDTIQRDPKMRPTFDELHDHSAVTEAKISTKFLKDFTLSFTRYDGQNRGARIAFVAPSDEIFGLSRMVEILRDASPPEFHVFREMASAREWLGLPPDDECSAAWLDI